MLLVADVAVSPQLRSEPIGNMKPTTSTSWQIRLRAERRPRMVSVKLGVVARVALLYASP